LFVDLDERLRNCLATILDGVCRPLNVRIEQALLSSSDCITVNKIDLLLQAHVGIIDQVNLDTFFVVFIFKRFSNKIVCFLDCSRKQFIGHFERAASNVSSDFYKSAQQAGTELNLVI